jgi:TolB-like protein
VGYAGLVEADEAGTLVAVKALQRELIDPLTRERHGRVVKVMGDGAIIEFTSVVDAVACAVAIQRAVAARQANVAVERRIVYRIGVNLGDVVVEGEDLLGDGVIVAARLEQLCEPGGVAVSGTAYDHLQGKINQAIEYLGERQVKNIARAVRVYRVRLGDEARPVRPTLALPDRPSIAVLPFTNLSGDPEQDYFADGMVEEIIAALSRMRWLFVIARNSSFTYRGHAFDVKQVGRELGVRYVLEGSVRRAGDRVRITGQLLDASTGGHLWADRFGGKLADIFDLQDQITASVVGAIAPKLERAEIDRAQRKPTDSLDAYDHFLRGMAGIHGWTREANAAAFACFTRAIALDPHFAAAYGMAARCFSQRKASGWVEDRQKEIAEATRLARRAAELGTEDAIALCGAAMVLSYVIGDLDTASTLIARALILDPNFAWGWHVSGWIRGWLGEPEIAIEHAARAMRLSPTDPHTFTMRTSTACAHFLAGRFDDALAWAQEVTWERPGFLIATMVVAAAAALADRPTDAGRAMTQLCKTAPEMRLGNLRDYWPIRRPEDFTRWHEGLRRAGLPP